jgi:anti-anti-sigma regulatory factor
VREHGLVSSARGLGVNDHACWAYDNDADATRAVLEYLADGVSLGQRLIYVADAPVEELRAQLLPLEGAEALIDRGALRVATLSEMYDVEAGSDAEALLATYAEATEEALAAGYTGLRVAAEVTPLARDRANWAAHTHWESVIDRYMTDHPLSALCLYDRRRLAGPIVDELAAIHPACCAHANVLPFRLYAEADRTMLEGEIDRFGVGSLRRLLPLAIADAPEGVLDVSGVDFIDHHGLVALARAAHEVDGEGVAVIGLSPHMRRLCDLLEVSL